MKRREQARAPVVEPPKWVTHFEVGLRHVGSVTEAGVVHLGGLARLNAARDRWYVENGVTE